MTEPNQQMSSEQGRLGVDGEQGAGPWAESSPEGQTVRGGRTRGVERDTTEGPQMDQAGVQAKE